MKKQILSNIREQFEHMSPSQQKAFKQERPEIYAQIIKLKYYPFPNTWSKGNGEVETGQSIYRV